MMTSSAATPESRGHGDDARDAVATNVRRHRLVRGMSLRDLAEATGSSKGLLSQIENGAANPTLQVLGRIGDALGVTVTELLRLPLLAPDIVRASEESVDEVRDVAIRTLFDSPDRRRMELSEASMPSNTRSSKTSHGTGSIEYAYLVDGAVTLESDGWTVDLKRGDAVRFSAEFEHAYATGEQPARIVTLVGFSE